jgi:hypothetical protein
MRIKTITQDHAANGVNYYIVLDVHHWGIEATVHNMGSDEFREHRFVDYSVDEVINICRNIAIF